MSSNVCAGVEVLTTVMKAEPFVSLMQRTNDMGRCRKIGRRCCPHNIRVAVASIVTPQRAIPEQESAPGTGPAEVR